MRQHYPESLRAIFVAGERCDPDTMQWMQRQLRPGVAVADNWWQTELGSPAIAHVQVRARWSGR
jgi:propionyl-CoA synthetase